MILEYIDSTLNILGVIIVVLGFVIALKTYQSERKKDRLEREYGTFNDLDDKYVEFMYKCTEFPQLDFFSREVSENRVVNEHEENIERAMFSVLISIFERAYLMFDRHDNLKIKQQQYDGWLDCMSMYCVRKNFLFEWQAIGEQFDKDFQVVMNKVIKKELKRISKKKTN